MKLVPTKLQPALNTKQPFLLVLVGPPAVGKTTVTRALGSICSVCIPNQEDVLRELIPGSDFGSDDRLRAYDEMHKRAASLLNSGENVVLDGTYSRRTYRDGLSGDYPLFADVWNDVRNEAY